MKAPISIQAPSASFRLVFTYLLLLATCSVAIADSPISARSESLESSSQEQRRPSSPELRIEGSVLDPERRAVTDVRVELRALLPSGADRPTVYAESDARGRFAVLAPAAGVYALTVSAPGRVPLIYEPLPVVESRRLHGAVLPPAESAEITVRYADGRPMNALDAMGGLRIEATSSHLAPAPGHRGWRPALRTTAVGPDGRAVVPRLRGELLDLVLRRLRRSDTANVDGQIDPEIDREIDRRSGVTQASFSLTETSTMRMEHARRKVEPTGEMLRARGRVLGADDQGLADALVWSDDDPGRFTISRADGRFELPARPGTSAANPTAGSWSALAPGYQPVTVTVDSEQPLILRPAPRRAGFGRVLDLESRPIAGVLVTVRAARDHRSAHSLFAHTRTDDDGTFFVDALPAPVVDLRAHHPDFVATVVPGIQTDLRADMSTESDGNHGIDIELDTAGDPGSRAVDLGTVFLAPGAPLHGRAVDQAGRPVAEVKVWASADLSTPTRRLLSRPPSGAPDAVSDADGRFVITGTGSGDLRRLHLRAEGFVPQTLAAMPAGNEAQRPFRAVLRRGLTVDGRVLDDQGRPVADAHVSAEPVIALDQPTLPGPEAYGSIRTDEQGRFRFTTLSPRHYEFSVQAAGFRPSQTQGLDLRAVEGPEAPSSLVFDLERGAVLRGRITNDRGEPVADARVLVSRVGASTDAQGRYRVDGLDPGPQVARIVHPAYRAAERPVEIVGLEPHRLDVELPAGHRVFGRTVDPEGLPVPRVSLYFDLDEAEQAQAVLRRSTSDADGFFELADVPDGTYSVVTERPGFATVELPAALRVDGEPVHDLEIELERGATVEGEILGVDFEQLASIQVRAEGESGPSLDGRVSHDGRFVIENLPSGPWLLTAELPDDARQARSRLRIEPGRLRIRRDLRFDGGELSAEILLDGEALADAEVTLEGRDVALTRSALTDHLGEIHISDLVPGRYRLHVSYPRRWVSHSRELSINNGFQDTRIDIESLIFEGIVRSADDGEALAGTRVGLGFLAAAGDPPADGEAMHLFSVTSKDDGRFHVPRLSAGRYRLQVSHEGFGDHEEVLDLRPGMPTHPVELRPSPGFELKVVGGSGSAPPWVSGRFQRHDGREISETRPVSDGVARFSSLPAGRWTALWSAPGRATVEAAVEVPGRLEVDLPPAADLQIRVPALEESDTLAQVSLRLPDGRTVPVTTEPTGPARQHPVIAGAARLGGIPAGPWTVEVQAADGRIWRAAFVAEAERRHHIQLE